MRLFIAIDLPDSIREAIHRFQQGVRGFAPDVRWVGSETFHITLKFIGEKPPETVDDIKRALAEIKSPPAQISFRGYGFFPTANSARVFWTGIEADANLVALASAIDAATAKLGILKEEHPFTPHLTLARAGSGRPQRKSGDAPSRRFQHLQEKLSALPAPDFGTMTAREFFLYLSKTSPHGAQYTKLARFPLT